MRNWKLKHRILFLALMPVWLISVLLTILIVIVGTTEIDGALKARGAVIVRQLAPASEYGAFSGNREVLQALTQSVMKEDDAHAVIITDPQHKILAVSGKPSRLEVAHAEAADRGTIIRGKNHSLIFAAPIYQGHAQLDSFDLLDRSPTDNVSVVPNNKLLGRVYVELSTVSSEQTKSMFVIISVLIGLVGTACASILALRMSHDITKPLSQLIQGVHNMAHGDLGTRLAAHAGGELEELENGFNLMASEIESSHNKMMAININLEHLIAARTTELEQKNQELETLSNTDRLTGLYNRFKLEKILESELARSQRYGSYFSIAIIDIDKFKNINDTYGHQVGDQVLIGIANILKENIRQIDAVGRWGGEEFLVIFRETPLNAAISTAEKLRAAIAGHSFNMIGKKTASFGVTGYRHPDTISDMMVRADNALYHAKRSGRNRVEFKEL